MRNAQVKNKQEEELWLLLPWPVRQHHHLLLLACLQNRVANVPAAATATTTPAATPPLPPPPPRTRPAHAPALCIPHPRRRHRLLRPRPAPSPPSDVSFTAATARLVAPRRTAVRDIVAQRWRQSSCLCVSWRAVLGYTCTLHSAPAHASVLLPAAACTSARHLARLAQLLAAETASCRPADPARPSVKKTSEALGAVIKVPSPVLVVDILVEILEGQHSPTWLYIADCLPPDLEC